MFSQGAGLSQLSCEISGDEGMEPLRSQREGGVEFRVIPMKKNPPIMAAFESRLKGLEKKRISFLSKIKKEDDKKGSHLDSHEARKKQSIDLQMVIEGSSEEYRRELSERNPFNERSKYYYEIVNIFKEHFLKAKETEEVINKDSKTIKSDFKNSLSSENLATKKKELIRSSISSEIEKEKCTIEDYRKDIINTRECSVNIIKTCAVENEQAASNIDFAMEKVTAKEKDERELLNTYNELTPKIKSDFRLVIELQQQSNELMTFRSTNIQNSKLQLNTEQSTNANLGGKFEDLEEILNTSTKKRKELSNLTCQLKVAVEDLMKLRSTNTKIQEENINQKCGMKNKCKSLDEDLNKLKDVRNLNESMEIEVNTWKKSIELNSSVMFEVDQYLINKKNEIEDNKLITSKIMSEKSGLEALCSGLQNIECKLNLKLDDLKILNDEESRDKLLKIKTTEEGNVIMSNKRDQLDEDIMIISDLISGLQENISSTENGIIKFEDEAIQNIKNLQCRQTEIDNEIESLLRCISKHKCEDDNYLITIGEAIPIQKELPDLISTKKLLIKAISEENLSFQQELNEVEQIFNAKILAIEKEMEMHASVIDGLIKAEEESTQKMKEELKATEEIKMALEQDLSYYKSRLSTLKSQEDQKRMKIVNTDKKFRTINKEVKVTREDITDAINGKSQAPKTIQSQNHLTLYSLDSLSRNNCGQPPVKRIAYGNEFKHIPQVQHKVINKKSREPVHVDDYDFSEWNQ